MCPATNHIDIYSTVLITRSGKIDFVVCHNKGTYALKITNSDKNNKNQTFIFNASSLNYLMAKSRTKKQYKTHAYIILKGLLLKYTWL